jgi:hypothetical protein
LTKSYVAGGQCEAPAHALFPQIAKIVQRYFEKKRSCRRITAGQPSG